MDKKKRFFLFVGLMVLLIGAGYFFKIDVEKIDVFLGNIPIVYSGFVFILLYIIGTFFLWGLKDPLKIVGAVLFGAYVSTFLIYLSEIVNAYIFFKFSKQLGKDYLESSAKGRFKNFYEKLSSMSLPWLFLLRGVPLIPYRVLDLSFGLSKVSFKKYLIVVLLASLPRIFIIQFILAGIRAMMKGGSMSVFPAHEMAQYLQDNVSVCVAVMVYYFGAFIAAFVMKRKYQI